MQHELRLVRYFEEILGCRNAESAWDVLGAEMRQYGFDRMMFGLADVSSDGQVEDISDAVMLFHGEQSYVDRYLEGGFYRNAPLFFWAFRNRGAISWRDPAGGLDPETLARQRPGMLKLMREYDVRAGYSISLAEPEAGDVAVITLCARPGLDQDEVEALWQRHGKQVEMTCSMFYLRIKALPRPVQTRPLTSRQKEVLRWVAAGKTARDVAQIMDISTATVDKHLAAVRTAFDVLTTAQAVKKATRFNLI